MNPLQFSKGDLWIILYLEDERWCMNIMDTSMLFEDTTLTTIDYQFEKEDGRWKIRLDPGEGYLAWAESEDDMPPVEGWKMEDCPEEYSLFVDSLRKVYGK